MKLSRFMQKCFLTIRTSECFSSNKLLNSLSSNWRSISKNLAPFSKVTKLCQPSRKRRYFSRHFLRDVVSEMTVDNLQPLCFVVFFPASSRSSTESFRTSRSRASSRSCSIYYSSSRTEMSGENWSTWSPRFPGI